MWYVYCKALVLFERVVLSENGMCQLNEPNKKKCQDVGCILKYLAEWIINFYECFSDAHGPLCYVVWSGVLYNGCLGFAQFNCLSVSLPTATCFDGLKAVIIMGKLSFIDRSSKMIHITVGRYFHQSEAVYVWGLRVVNKDLQHWDFNSWHFCQMYIFWKKK